MPLRRLALITVLVHGLAGTAAFAQTPPSRAELAAYAGLHAAAAKGDMQAVRALLSGGGANARDAHGRTPLHVAAHFSHGEAARALVAGGGDPRAAQARRSAIRARPCPRAFRRAA